MIGEDEMKEMHEEIRAMETELAEKRKERRGKLSKGKQTKIDSKTTKETVESDSE